MKFKDKKGDEWDLTLDLGKVQAIDRGDYSLICPGKTICLIKGDPTEVPEMVGNTGLMFAIIWNIVQDQAPKILGITEDSLANEEGQLKAQALFAKRIGGAQVDPARQAFVEALGDFFPAAKIALLSLVKSLEDQRQKVSKRLATMEPEINQALDREVDHIFQGLSDDLKSFGTGEKSKSSLESSTSPTTVGNV